MDITCASMGDGIKNYIKHLSQCEAFKRFSTGQEFEGNLKQKTVKGGVILESKPFKIR